MRADGANALRLDISWISKFAGMGENGTRRFEARRYGHVCFEKTNNRARNGRSNAQVDLRNSACIADARGATHSDMMRPGDAIAPAKPEYEAGTYRRSRDQAGTGALDKLFERFCEVGEIGDPGRLYEAEL